MNFAPYFSKKIALSKDNKNNLSRIIIFIGRLSVALGVIVSLLTISIGQGSKEAIKLQMADFNGHVNIKSQKSNTSYDSSVLDASGLDIEKIKNTPSVASVQQFLNVTGIMRTEDNFAGIVFKGVDKDFDKERFEKFITEGKIPQLPQKGYSNEILVSEKIASDLQLKLNDSIVTIFSKADKNPIYRKFKIAGLYKTDIKMIDEQFVIGDINHARKIADVDKNAIGGLDVFFQNVNEIDTHTPTIEQYIGLKNYVESATDKYPQIVDMIAIFDNNIAVIIGIMLSVVIINIIMVLLILIIERTNSIGILKTLGANNFQIQKIFIYYTLIIMLPGLFYGNIIGVGLLLAQRFLKIIRLNPDNYYISTVPVDLNPMIPLLLSLGILTVSAISLILPSYLISKISPVKSIKYN